MSETHHLSSRQFILDGNWEYSGVLVDYLGIGEIVGDSGIVLIKSSTILSDLTQFIRGNIILMGVVAAFSAMTLLQKSLSHHPAIHLTAWMFGIGFVGCFSLLLLDSVMGNMITCCSLDRVVLQVYVSFTTSPLFRFGVVYSSVFVGGAYFTIGSLFAATQPPVTALLEWAFVGNENEFGCVKLGGMACVCLGIYSFAWIKKVP